MGFKIVYCIRQGSRVMVRLGVHIYYTVNSPLQEFDDMLIKSITNRAKRSEGEGIDACFFTTMLVFACVLLLPSICTRKLIANGLRRPVKSPSILRFITILLNTPTPNTQSRQFNKKIGTKTKKSKTVRFSCYLMGSMTCTVVNDCHHLVSQDLIRVL